MKFCLWSRVIVAVCVVLIFCILDTDDWSSRHNTCSNMFTVYLSFFVFKCDANKAIDLIGILSALSVSFLVIFLFNRTFLGCIGCAIQRLFVCAQCVSLLFVQIDKRAQMCTIQFSIAFVQFNSFFVSFL